MTITLGQVEEARRNIAGVALRTPLVRLNDDDHDVFLKLENLQPIGSFKIRGAANVTSRMPRERLERGLLTASAGNMAQGVAFCARRLGVSATIVAPDTAPATKVRAVERLGGRVIKVPFEQWWRAFEERAFPGIDATFVHAFDDPDVMAGNGTIGLELLEDLTDIDSIVIPWGGGGLACGVAAVVKALRPATKIYAAEIETAAPLAAALAAGSPQVVEYRPSFVDGIGSKTVFPGMFALAGELLEDSLVVSLAEARDAMRLVAERNRVICEGAAACAVAGALRLPGKVVAIVSGGNIDLPAFCELVS